MNAERLLAHYEKISDAPDAITRLRRFILDLAVRGKLVPQDPKDEPAWELLQRIAKEKARLMSSGEIRKEKPLSPVDNDAGFGVPPTWRWTRLGIVTSYIQRGKSPKYASSGGSLIVSQKCVQWPGLDLSVAKKVTLESLADYEGIRFLRDGDLLWNSTGTGTIGRIIRLVDLPEKLVCDSHVTVVRCLVVDPEYIRTWLRSDHVYALIEDRAAGSTNQIELTAQMAINQVVPLPPLAEQHRIVAKVDELMALCDRLEAARAEREATRDRLAASSLTRLNAPDPVTFQADARFVLNALPALTTRPDQIKRLRQTILNLAVRGRLVPQDPNDEPASELLKRIARTKLELWRTKKLKSNIPITNSISMRESIELPGTWQWASCDELFFVTKLAGFEYTKHFDLKNEGDVPVIRAQNVRPWTIEENNLKFISLKTSLILERSAITKPALLITFIGAGIGDVALIETKRRWHLAPNVAKAELFEGCDSLMNLKYVVMFFNSPVGRAEIFKHIKTTAQPSLSMGTIRDMDVVVPPLAEQHRIVAKVDALMALCDRLEASLTATAATRRRLLDALLAEALAPVEDREKAA